MSIPLKDSAKKTFRMTGLIGVGGELQVGVNFPGLKVGVGGAIGALMNIIHQHRRSHIRWIETPHVFYLTSIAWDFGGSKLVWGFKIYLENWEGGVELDAQIKKFQLCTATFR
jgi:hypothetical protein